MATIAYARLTPRARARVSELLAVPVAPYTLSRQSRDFVDASVWADEVRGEPGFEPTRPWHFVDNPFGITPETPLPPGLPSAQNILAALRKEIAVLHDPAAKQGDRARALRFVIHLVGDIHQPLHCATRISPLNPDGDRGGNDYAVIPPQNTRGDNLHAFWDDGLGAFPPDDAADVARAAGRIARRYPASVGA